MSDFTMKLGNFEAVPEISGSDNFATGIYENDYDGLLIARCNQNGRYPEHARAILEGLNGKKHGLDQITTLTAERDSLKALCDDMAKALERLAELTPRAANAATANDLHFTVSAIAMTALEDYRKATEATK